MAKKWVKTETFRKYQAPINTPEHISALKAEIKHLQHNVLNTQWDNGHVIEAIRILEQRVRELEAREIHGAKFIKKDSVE